MRDPNRIREICAELEYLWNKYPDWRLGQLLENYIFFQGQRGDRTSVRLFFQEDDETLDYLKQANAPVKKNGAKKKKSTNSKKSPKKIKKSGRTNGRFLKD